MLILGIDDAGRGPVIGPLIIAGVLLKDDDSKKLKKLGVTDSKLLSPGRREELFEVIKKTAMDFFITKTTPSEIDESLSNNINLNEVEAIKTAMVINKLGKKDIKTIVDCPSVNTEKWKEILKKYLEDKDLRISCEHKADFNHVEVAAASIIAKVTRDREIKEIQKKIKENIGSGYPSDPMTKEFLKHAHKYKDLGILRESWATWKNMLKSGNQRKLFDF